MKGVYKSVLVLVLSLVLLAVSFSCVAAADISVEDVSVSDVSVDIGGDVDVVPQVSGVANDEINSMESNVANLKASGTVYVGKNVTANGNGTYDDPYNNLKLAMDKKPTETIIKEGVYGGPENTVDLKGIVRAEDGANVIINGSNMAKYYIILRGATLKNLTFINFNAAAVLYLYDGNNTIEDCTFINNTGTNVACIDIEPGNNPNANIKNCTFINNHGMPSYVASVNKTYYNAAGAIYVGASNSGFPVVISDCTFINNTGVTSGAIKASPNKDMLVENCTFIDNNGARAGAVMVGMDSTINNCTFINNTADDFANTINWYGTYGNLYNSRILGNPDETAIFWFGDYGSIVNTTIEGAVGHASNVKFINSSVTNTSSFDVVNLDVSHLLKEDGKINYHGFNLSGRLGYCTERTVVDPPINTMVSFLLSNAKLSVINSFDDSEVIDYLKILYYNYEDVLNTTQMDNIIKIFVSKDYKNSNDTYVLKVLDDFDNGLRVADKGAVKKINDTTLKVYDFNVYSAFEYQNMIVCNTTLVDIVNNMSVSKSSLNDTVYLGNQTEFLIVVNNTGNYYLTGVYVVEDSFDDLVFDSWKAVSGNWTHSLVDGVHRFTLADSLSPNETAGFIVVFNTVSPGNKTNVIFGGSNEIDNVSAMNVTEVINTTTPGPEPTPTPTPEPTPTPGPEPTPTPTPEPTPVPGPEPSPEPSFESGSEPVVNKMVSTGNPLALIIISLFTIFVGGLKRKI